MALSIYPSIAKQFKLQDGTTYAYIFQAPTSPSKPTFLLLHGWPSSSYDWRHQIKGLTGHGYGVLVPDMLGYGDTDSPSEWEAYSFRRMSGHVNEILEHEGLGKVIGVGHDW
jgi:soluble epoxide hydrolase / lipid-phosphate phosphatase